MIQLEHGLPEEHALMFRRGFIPEVLAHLGILKPFGESVLIKAVHSDDWAPPELRGGLDRPNHAAMFYEVMAIGPDVPTSRLYEVGDYVITVSVAWEAVSYDKGQAGRALIVPHKHILAGFNPDNAVALTEAQVAEIEAEREADRKRANGLIDT